jgi:hypothetical protein
MHWRPRSPLTLVLAIFITHFIAFEGLAFSEPFSDRAFFVRWSNGGFNHTLRSVHFVAPKDHGEVDISFRVKTDGAEPRALVFARQTGLQLGSR